MSSPEFDGAPGILLVLDGWGHGAPGEGNALSAAGTPTLDALRAQYPSTLLEASGHAVGLPDGTVGNSEIGHMVIGAGRPLLYDSLLVQQEIDSGRLREHSLLRETCARLAAADGALHLVGLCSDGGIHADIEHLGALLEAAAAHGSPRVFVHVITDGRDVSDGTAANYLDRVFDLAKAAGAGEVASVVGRGYALDKAGNMQLTTAAGLAIAEGRGVAVTEARLALAAPHKGDEWVAPTVVVAVSGQPVGPVKGGDAVLLFNFRSDRIQQLADFLVDHFAAVGREVSVVSLAQYDTRASIPALVPRADAGGGIADVLAARGARSVRIAEPEKFEHVTFYINGRDETVRDVEEHVKIERSGPPQYTSQPQMNLDAVTAAVCSAATRPQVALVVANLANIDVVGHTGDFQATVQAAQHVDAAVAEIVAAAQDAGRWVVLVGDHGNAEAMTRPDAAGVARPYGGHTTNPVPFVIVHGGDRADAPAVLRGDGTLADVAPTVLRLLGFAPGAVMTGRSLL